MSNPPAERGASSALEAVLAGVLRRSRLCIVVLAGDASVVWANEAALQTLPALDPARQGANLADVVDTAAAGADWGRVTEALIARRTLPAFELPLRNGRWLRVELQALSKDVTDPRLVAALVLQDVTQRRLVRERERMEGELVRQATQRGGRVGAWQYDVDAGKVNWSDETFAIAGSPRSTPRWPAGTPSTWSSISSRRRVTLATCTRSDTRSGATAAWSALQASRMTTPTRTARVRRSPNCA